MTTTTTATIRRSPRITRSVVAVLAAAALLTAAYLARPASMTDTANRAAAPKALPVAADPLEVTQDLAPVVAAQQVAQVATTDALAATSDLTPVVAAHIEVALVSTDPLDVMRDFRNPQDYTSNQARTSRN